MTTLAAVAEQLAAFLQAAAARGLSEEAAHQTKRLLLNQLKATAEAVHQPAAKPLRDWAAAGPATRRHDAHVVWIGTRTAPPRAAAVNAMLGDQLDYGDTDLATGHPASAAVLGAALAQGEAGGHSGQAVLTALALGVEAGIACARLCAAGEPGAPTHAPVMAGVGAAAACCVLVGLDAERTAHALRLAMSTAPAGVAGPGARPYVTGIAAQSGQLACTLAQRGLQAPPEAFGAAPPGWAARTAAQRRSAEAVLGSLGRGGGWLFEVAMHAWPAPAWALAPIEATLRAQAGAEGRRVVRLQVGLPPAEWQRARAAMLCGAPALPQLVAAAWVRNQFTVDELLPAAWADPAIAALREAVEWTADAGVDSAAGCTLRLAFADGSHAQQRIDHFLGSPGQPLSDSQLSELFRNAAEDLVLPARAGEILQALWGLHATPDIRSLMLLLRPPG